MSAPRRDSVFDALRSIAIIMMVLSHSARLMDKDIRPDFFWAVLDLDALTQALFLGLVGVSLTLSLASARAREQEAGWLMGRARRAGELYLISMVLFFFDRGWQTPDVFTASGILADIGIGLLLFAPVAQLRRPIPTALVMTGAMAALAVWLHLADLRPFWIFRGNAPLLPTLIWTGLGLVLGQALLENRRKLLAGMGILSVIGGAFIVARYGLVESLTFPIGRHENESVYLGRSHGIANTLEMLKGEPMRTRTITWFNPTVISLPVSAALVSLLYAGLRLGESALDRLHTSIWLIGRYSLGVYVFHLILLAVPVMVMQEGKPLDFAWQAWTFVGVLLVLCYGYAAVRHQMVRRSRARAAAAEAAAAR